jgi:hypothetical protein
MSYPSNKYKQSLLQVKKGLMKDISRYLTKGIFEFKETRVIHKLISVGGTFPAAFDCVVGNEHYIKLSRTQSPFINVTDFSDETIDNVEKEIPFLMELLDTIAFQTK